MTMNYTDAKPITTAGTRARKYVQSGIAFRNHNKQLFGRWETPLLYVVYSYGEHWPLFAWDGFSWFENEDRYSPTTSKHRSHTHPHKETIKQSRDALRAMIAQRIGDYRQMTYAQRTLGIAA